MVNQESQIGGALLRLFQVDACTQTEPVDAETQVAHLTTHVSEGVQCNLSNMSQTTGAECEVCEMEVDNHDKEDVVDRVRDPDYIPDFLTTEALESEDQPQVFQPQVDMAPDKQRKYLVFESNLMELFALCPLCVSPIVQKELSVLGTLLVLKYKCKQGHCHTWSSQPCHKSLPWGNMLSAGAILFSGGSYAKSAKMFEHLNMSFISNSTYTRMQAAYLIPVVVEHYLSQRALLLNSIQGQDIVLGGDGR